MKQPQHEAQHKLPHTRFRITPSHIPDNSEQLCQQKANAIQHRNLRIAEVYKCYSLISGWHTSVRPIEVSKDQCKASHDCTPSLLGHKPRCSRYWLYNHRDKEPVQCPYRH